MWMIRVRWMMRMRMASHRRGGSLFPRRRRHGAVVGVGVDLIGTVRVTLKAVVSSVRHRGLAGRGLRFDYSGVLSLLPLLLL